MCESWGMLHHMLYPETLITSLAPQRILFSEKKTHKAPCSTTTRFELGPPLLLLFIKSNTLQRQASTISELRKRELKPVESKDSFSLGNWEELDSHGWYLWRSRHGRKQYWKLCKTSSSAQNFHWCFGDENHNFTVSILQKAVPAVLLQHASLICSRDECKKPLHLLFYCSVMQGSENCNNSFVLIIEALNESLKACFSTFGSYCGCFRLKFEMLNFNLRSIKQKAKKPPKPPSPFKMQGLVTVTATILWLPYHKLVKACMREWKGRITASLCVQRHSNTNTLCEHLKTIRCVGETGREAASCLVTPQRAVFPWGSHIPGVLSVLAASQPWVLLLCLGAAGTDCAWEHRLCTGYASVRDQEGGVTASPFNNFF